MARHTLLLSAAIAQCAALNPAIKLAGKGMALLGPVFTLENKLHWAEGRAGKTEGLGEFGAFSPFWGESGRGEALSGSFLGREGPQKSTPYPGFKLEFKKTHLKSKNST